MADVAKTIAVWCASLLEIAGVGVIAILALFALLIAASQLIMRRDRHAVFHESRVRMARGILLGLEFLVAADIIHTVAVDLTYTSVGVLAIVVAIRTFLSFTIELEITGHWPWEGRANATAPTKDPVDA